MRRAFVVQRDAGEIASDRRHHAPAPVFGDDGNPIAGKVDGRSSLRRFRSLLRRPAAPIPEAVRNALGDQRCGAERDDGE